MSTLGNFFYRIRSIGVTPEMDGFAIRRLGIFNLINFFGFTTGLVLPVLAALNDGYLPPIAWMVACSPAVISLGVLLAHALYKHQFALIWYFLLYPLVTSLVYVNSIDAGIELFFIFYGVLGVFFLQRIPYLIASIGFSMVCFIGVYLGGNDFRFVMAEINYPFFVLNHVIALVFIFGGLFLIKQENIAYQNELLNTNTFLSQYAQEIESQKEELAALNQIKTKMFSIISHDVRLPLYSLRNIFQSMRDYDMPGDQVKELVPEIAKDLSHTTELMENLLQWAKSQMAGESIQPQRVDLTATIDNVLQLIHTQASNKNITLEFDQLDSVWVEADPSMLETVVRNLCSNAIKFTPADGKITLQLEASDQLVWVHVNDTGVGMDDATQAKILGEGYYTTKGTSNESGTGLGLLICRDFVRKNGGDLTVHSELGVGTTFSFTIPLSNE